MTRAVEETSGRGGRPRPTLRLALPPPPYARRGGEIIAAELRAVGIQTQITNMEWAQWLEQVYKNADDLTIISHVEPDGYGIYGREILLQLSQPCLPRDDVPA